MQINEDYWGGAAKTTTDSAGCKWTSYNLMDAFNNGDLPFNEELDTSISPWAINKDADFLNLCYGLSYKSGTNTHATPVFYPIFDLEAETNGVPFYFMKPHYYGNAGTWYDWNDRNGLNQQQMTGGSGYPWYSHKIYPLKEFDYSKFFYLVEVKYATAAYNTNIWGISSGTTLANYFNNTDEWLEEHPIVSINLKPYYYGADSEHPTQNASVDWYINSLGKQLPLTDVPTDPLTGYNIPFIDNFMTVVYNGNTSAENPSIGMLVNIEIYKYEWDWTAYYAESYQDDADSIILNTSNYGHPICRVIKSEGRNSKWTVRSYWNGATRYVTCRTELNRSSFDSAADMQDYVLKQIAYIGTWFLVDSTDLQTTPGSTNNWYLGEIDDNGITTGNYKRGSAAGDYNNSQWENPWDDSPWQGRSDDPNQYSDTTDWNNLFLGTVPFTKTYLLNDLDVLALHTKFYDILSGLPNYSYDTVVGLYESNFLTSNPTDVIISLRWYNADLDSIINPGGNTTDLYLGAYNTQMVVGDGSTPVKKFNYGSCTYYPHFGDFRDYEPYSYAELIVPYCGTLKISPADFMGHKLSVEMAVDFATGACTAFVLRDLLVIDTISGQMGIDIPVTAIASADYQRDLFNNTQSLKQAKTQASQSIVGGLLNIGANLASGNIVGAAGAAVNTIFGSEKADIAIESAEYNLEHTPMYFKQVGSAAPAINALAEQKARLIIYRPIMSNYDPETYGHTNGYATVTTGALNNFSGYTKCSSIDVSGINCTALEKNMIISALQSGVYL